MVERDGWLLPAHYGDAAAEYSAVRDGGAGLFDLTPRGRIEVRGAEAVQFLNGLVTNDVQTLATGAWMHAALPNAQGRLLALARVLRPTAEEVFLFDTEAATRERVRETLARFTLAGDFRVRDLTDETAQVSVQGAKAAELIAQTVGDEVAQLERMHTSAVAWRAHTLTVARATDTGEDGFELIGSHEASTELRAALVETGAQSCSADTLEVLRIEAGVPRYGVDMSETNVVPESVPGEAISYTKGCYVGQEIIARIHWRGHVAKKLTGLLLADEDAPAHGALVATTDGREIGRITSSVFSPRLQRAVALAYVKYDYLAPDTDVRVGDAGTAARVAELPLVRGGWWT
jgi:folate-binding protein YgfZ